ncbi:MAG: hydrogenase iron-sulfur subunit, partial [Planctomycetota bacterium]|nr:hydrogenase iron-sulfur subunit [Planctomycetota bacterium]
AAADTAGTQRLSYPPNLQPVSVNCTGAIDGAYIFQAFVEGADGVLIGGCHPGDCHYRVGNYRARRRMAQLEKIMETLGLEKQRLRVRWVGASEAQRFADVVKEFVDEIRTLGPTPFRRTSVGD